MLRYIPDFILQKHDNSEQSGSFSGYAMFFDIADFTPIGTQLQKQGKEGAEELSRFLDFVFGQPIQIVESCGGFVSHFAGDAFCAIFPEASELGILDAVNAIREFFKDKESYHTPLGDFALKVRQTIAWGEINWQIYDNPSQSEYVFYGDTLAEMAELSLLKEDCIFSTEALKRLEHDTVAELSEAPYLVGVSATDQQNPATSYSHNPETFSHFLQQRLLSQKPDNEIRSAAFCFASLEAIPTEERNEAVAKLAALSQNFGAYINKLDATDKGLTALILFGLPRSEGKTLERICSFALEAVEALPLLALGISCGSVFAGYTGSGEISEYTAFGHPLNLAARLMSKARAGEVLTDTYLWQELHASYDFYYLGSLNLKGIEQPIRYYRIKQLTQRSHREEQRFVGRETELNSIRETIDSALNAKENIVLYVSGDAGIGKSRLVSEALAIYGVENSDSPQPNRNSAALKAAQCQLYYITCDAILRKPLEAIKQMLRSQFYYNSSLPMAAAIPMFRALWGTISPGDSEMQRIESFLASLLGYEWEGSIWSMLPPEERPKQLKNAFVYFIKKLCQSGEREFSTPYTGKAILIHLDDGQWLDEESQSYFQAISEAEICPVIFISPCRYLEDGNKADLQLPKHLRKDIELDSLNENGCLELTKSIMRLNEIPIATQELIYNRSMGNPLFIEQLSSYLMETGSLNAKGEIVQELGYLSSFSISDIVSNRIDRLTDNVKECLFSASVLGMEFNIKVLSEMLKTDLTTELEAGIQSRIWKDLDELRYIFSHILIKDIVNQRMMSDKLKELHKLAAEAMEIVYKEKLDENAEEIALHYEKANICDKAVGFYIKSGRFYKLKYDFESAMKVLNKSFELHQKNSVDENNITAICLNELALIYKEQGEYRIAKSLLERALRIRVCILGDCHEDTIDTKCDLGDLFEDLGDYEHAEFLFQQALETKKDSECYCSFKTAVILNYRAVIYNRRREFHKAKLLLLEAIDMFITTVGELHPEIVHSIINLAYSYAHLNDREKAESLYKKALDLQSNTLENEHLYRAYTMYYLACFYQSTGAYNHAETLLQNVCHMRDRILGSTHPHSAMARKKLVDCYIIKGSYANAESQIVDVFNVLQMKLGLKHPWTIETINCLIDLFEKMNEPVKIAHYKAMLPKEEEAPEKCPDR